MADAFICIVHKSKHYFQCNFLFLASPFDSIDSFQMKFNSSIFAHFQHTIILNEFQICFDQKKKKPPIENIERAFILSIWP